MNAYLPESVNNCCFIGTAIEKELKVLFQIYIKMHFYDSVELPQDFRNVCFQNFNLEMTFQQINI